MKSNLFIISESGSGVLGMEVEMEDDETDMTKKSMVDRSFRKIAIGNDHEQNQDSSAPPATPLPAIRYAWLYSLLHPVKYTG